MDTAWQRAGDGSTGRGWMEHASRLGDPGPTAQGPKGSHRGAYRGWATARLNLKRPPQWHQCLPNACQCLPDQRRVASQRLAEEAPPWALGGHASLCIRHCPGALDSCCVLQSSGPGNPATPFGRRLDYTVRACEGNCRRRRISAASKRNKKKEQNAHRPEDAGWRAKRPAHPVLVPDVVSITHAHD